MSLELRNGMWLAFLPIETNTSVKLLRLLFIDIASLALSPKAPLRFNRSEPAKSTKFNTPLIDFLCSG